MKNPRLYQRTISRKAEDYFHINERGKLIMACGTGKTLSSLFIAQRLHLEKIIIAVPNLNLERQTMKTWIEEYGKKANYLCICSDQTIKEDIEIDDIVIPVTTNIQDACFWLRMHHKKPIIIFTTYQSGNVVCQAVKRTKTEFDLGILDEAHRTVGKSDKEFSKFLFDKNLKIKYRLFTTATEKIYSGSSDGIISMDNKELYGDSIYELTTKDAIQRKILCDYGIITMYSKIDSAVKLIRQNPFVIDPKHGLTEKQKALLIATAIVTLKTIKKKNMKHVISYHNTIKMAQIFKDLIQHVSHIIDYDIDTFHLNGNMNTSLRNEILSQYKESECAIITNAKALQEGVDITEVDGVVFADKKDSTTDIIHSVGRALRKHKGKDKSYVLVPCFISKQNNFDNYSELEKDFGNILMVLKSMATTDSRITDYFRSLNTESENTSQNSIIENENEDILNIDIKKIHQYIQYRAWEKTARLFYRDFNETKNFALSLHINGSKKWMEYCKNGKKPLDIPACPNVVYKNKGWKGWGDFLGTGNSRIKYVLPFKKAKQFVRKLQLNSVHQWRSYYVNNRPHNIPSCPNHSYREWKGWGDFLGTNKMRSARSLSYRKAKQWARKLKLKTVGDWKIYCKSGKKPLYIPHTPHEVYRKRGWTNYYDFLGIKKLPMKSFTQCRKFVRTLKLKNVRQWEEYVKKKKKPIDIPAAPEYCYRGQWKGWHDFLVIK